jgi:alpha-1,6-mannosyl-glycoprotein beta-1,2-N-acetylglucosaminyltransferase
MRLCPSVRSFHAPACLYLRLLSTPPPMLAPYIPPTFRAGQDADDAGVRDVATEFVKSGALPKLRLVSHPWSCARHPNSFPANDPQLNVGYKGDTYGNPRSEWATCLKHHWWWLMNYVWSSGADTVCMLEDDVIIKPGTLEWLASHEADLSAGFGIKLTTQQIAVPWCLGRAVWAKVHAAGREFCTHDDYNWDQTLAWLASPATSTRPVGVLANLRTVTMPSTVLSKHVGTCEGWDSGGRNAKCTAADIRQIEEDAAKWMSAAAPVNSHERKGDWLKAHAKINGGWGHPRDHEHCLEVSANVTRSMDEECVAP